MSPVSTQIPFAISNITSVLSENLASVVYPANAQIFQEGELASSAYLIERGRVHITTGQGNNRRSIAVLEAGELLGEMAPIDEEVRSATAVTLEETEVIPIGKEDLQEAISSASPLVQLLVRELLNRARYPIETSHTASSVEHEMESRVLVGAATEKLVRGRAVEYLTLKKDLSEALSRREFDLYFQPIVRLSDFTIAGFEALIRWRSPSLGFVNPIDFIPVAEDFDVINPIGLWVLEHACHVLQKFQARMQRCSPQLPPPFITVNVSARQLKRMKDVEKMVSVINDTGIMPEQLELEITEGVLIKDPEMAAAGLERLKQLGVSFAIDDFGTGYSSLSYLNRYPLDTLKIDRSFVSSMLTNASSFKIVQAITTLAKELDMDIVAEGTEQVQQVTRLTELGCQYAQGFLFAEPGTVDKIMTVLDNPAAWQKHVRSLGFNS